MMCNQSPTDLVLDNIFCLRDAISFEHRRHGFGGLHFYRNVVWVCSEGKVLPHNTKRFVQTSESLPWKFSSILWMLCSWHVEVWQTLSHRHWFDLRWSERCIWVFIGQWWVICMYWGRFVYINAGKISEDFCAMMYRFLTHTRLHLGRSALCYQKNEPNKLSLQFFRRRFPSNTGTQECRAGMCS